MFICSVCNGKSYTTESGLFYCSDCHTRVEGWREEDREYALTLSTGVRQKSMKTKTLQQLTNDENKLEWTSWQLYNHILAVQVGELENLPGVSHGFRFIVLTLWTRYLRCKGYAFLDKPLPSRERATCKRDLAALANINIAAMFQKKKKPAKRRGSSEADDTLSETTLTSLADTTHKTGVEFVSDARSQGVRRGKLKRSMFQRMADDQQSGISDDPWDSESYKSFETDSLSFSMSSLIQSRSSVSEAVSEDFKLCIFHTELNRRTLLAILYLGLLISKSKTQLVDLLRWVKAGDVSFMELLHLLPEEMIVTQEDLTMFGALPLMPKAIHIYEVALHNCVTIGVSQLPFPDIAEMAERFIKELHLPGMLSIQVKKLIVQYPFKYADSLKCLKKLPSFEYKAMAYVIVLLKLLFGLDDVQEVYWSEVARQMNSKSGKQFAFEWELWVEMVEYRNLMLAQHVTSPKASIYQQHRELEREAKQSYHYGVDDFCQRNLQRQLNNLAQHAAELSTGGKLNVPPSLFHFHDAVQKLKQLNHTSIILDHDFTNTNINYLMDFCTDSLLQRGGSKCFRQIEKICALLSCTTKIRINLHESCGDFHVQRLTLRQAMQQANFTAVNSYWFLPIHVRDRATDFQKVKCKLPMSFQWLLKQCAIVLGDDDVITLYDEVYRVEKLTILHSCSHSESTP